MSMPFADALRDWRLRRRVSQLDLAMRAGTTQRHLSFIERGRSVPGRGMVVRLAEALEIPLRHRNALLLSAGYAPVYEETTFEAPELDPVRTALMRLLAAHDPFPAVLTDRSANLVAGNAAFEALADGVTPTLRAPPVNVPRLFLHPGGLAPRILNLDVWGWHVIEALRRIAARSATPALDALASELEPLLPPRSRESQAQDAGVAVPLRIRVPKADGEWRLLTTLAHFGTTTNVTLAELTLEAFLPADERTARDLSGARRSFGY
jgi:transcriptional regulator with XRE-family HTH domain